MGFSANIVNKVKVAIVKDFRSQPGCEFDERVNACMHKNVLFYVLPYYTSSNY